MINLIFNVMEIKIESRLPIAIKPKENITFKKYIFSRKIYIKSKAL